jgi:alpha-D-xyloside xylohydrolase
MKNKSIFFIAVYLFCVYSLLSAQVVVETAKGQLKLTPFDFGVLHIQLTPSNQEARKSYAVVNDFQTAEFQVGEDNDNLILLTNQYKLVLNKQTGSYILYDATGKHLLKESNGLFKLSDDEALYGLGQFRDNALNLRGRTRELVQFNTQAAVPVLFSTAGWGILWDNPSRTVFQDNADGMSLKSDYGDVIDYYLFVGNSLDNLIASYRQLTGKAPMIPYWSLGFHQSRNRYRTQNEVLSIAQRMAEENIQMSSIFIDYYYWEKYGTGSHQFDETLFPDPKGMLETLHDKYQTQAVITLWPTFKKGTANYNELESKGMLLDGAIALDGIIYDVFNPEARKVYWNQLLPFIKIGMDGYFLDGPEPDHPASFLQTNTFAGPAPTVRNLYPLLHVENFYNNMVDLYPNKRPYIITRCAWAGQQRAGAAVWSGDIPVTFDELQKQVAAGLNFVATGIPYWTTDIGGYSGGDPADEEYREVFTRWFQYGTFCPIFRSHGRRYPGDRTAPNELWAYGKDVQNICTEFINLRYTLMPYIYSLTGDVTHKDYTPMRLLAFDFPEDKNVLDCKDQFMYGSAFLICPVLKAGHVSREVYLPKGNQWFDFWTGEKLQGGQKLIADAPINQMPIYVKAGAIIPTYLNDDKNNTPDNALKVYIYKGADGSFELYKDDGKSFEYKNEDFAYIPFYWNDKTNELIIDIQKGNYNKGQSQEMQIVLVDGKYENIQSIPVTKTIEYTGNRQQIQL